MTAALPAEDAELIKAGLRRDKRAVAALVSAFEDQRESALERRARLYQALCARSPREGFVLGLTGTPGSGKSSLLSRLAPELLRSEPSLSIALLAVDPSSRISHGALLGDRTRMRLPLNEPRVFFRSQASQTQLGGLGPWTFQVCRLLVRLFDCVLVETVGIGQSEADVRNLADRVFLVLQPLGGDELQFVKAGIMEIPDAFVLNKSDEPTAARSYHALRGSLSLARPFDSEQVPIYRTSARTGEGLEALTDVVKNAIAGGPRRGFETKQPYFFEQWVREQWGRFGLQILDRDLGTARAFLEASAGFDTAQANFAHEITRRLR